MKEVMNTANDRQVHKIQSEEEGNLAASATVSSAGNANTALRKEAEKKLRESEKHYRSLVMATAQIVWRANARDIAGGDVPLLGASTHQGKENLEGHSRSDAIHPGDRERVYSSWNQAVSTSTPFEIEYRVRRSDGVYRTFSARGVPVFETNGGIREWVGTCTDISERKEAEKKLHESEKRYRDLADAMPQIVWTARPDGYHDYYNHRWFEYTGLSEEESLAEEGWKAALHPDDVELCVNRWYQAVQTGDAYEIECRFKRSSDRTYRWHLGRALPVRSVAGQIVKWFGTCTDIDDQKRAEEELRARARQQVTVAELSQHALVGTDLSVLLEKVVTLVAQTLMVEYSVIEEFFPGSNTFLIRAGAGWDEEIVGQAELGAAKQDSQAGYTLAFNEPLIVSDLRTETRFRTPPLVHDHGLVSSISVIIAGQGLPFGVLIAHSTRQRTFTQDDIHFLQAIANMLATAIERKRVETDLAQALVVLQTTTDELEHANKVQSDFISIVSHEFRTTLTGIQGFSELMRDEEFSVQEIKEYAADINADAKRLSRMITELLDLNRMKSGRMTLNLEQVDLNAIIMDVIDRVRPTTPHHQLRLQLDDALPLLSGDRDKLTQVITNLLSNAVKYSPAGGEILLSSGVEENLAHVRVQDQGIGIPSNALERVFESYSRIESGITKYIEGTGLGLPIVRQIIELHGGKAWAESVLGKGSTFHFTLPLSGVASTAGEKKKSSA